MGTHTSKKKEKKTIITIPLKKNSKIVITGILKNLK